MIRSKLPPHELLMSGLMLHKTSNTSAQMYLHIHMDLYAHFSSPTYGIQTVEKLPFVYYVLWTLTPSKIAATSMSKQIFFTSSNSKRDIKHLCCLFCVDDLYKPNTCLSVIHASK